MYICLFSCILEVNTEYLLRMTAKHHDCTEVFVGPKSTSLQGKTPVKLHCDHEALEHCHRVGSRMCSSAEHRCSEEPPGREGREGSAKD